MIFVDSNIPMYLIGADHPHKSDSKTLLERCVTQGDRLITDAEVLQEILHRYVAIGRRDAIGPAFEALLTVVDEVFPVTRDDVERAREIVLTSATLSARDAVHLSVMETHGVSTILSFDHGLDGHPGITRLGA